MKNSYKCPQCGKYIIGSYCCTCKKGVHDMKVDNPFKGSPFEDIFKNLTPEE